MSTRRPRDRQSWPLRSGVFLSRGFFAVYRHAISPVLHATHRTLTGSAGACRFQPTCGEYAMLAWHTHGPARGGWLALRRMLRCHPFTRGGFDPVPQHPALNSVSPETLNIHPGAATTPARLP